MANKKLSKNYFINNSLIGDVDRFMYVFQLSVS